MKLLIFITVIIAVASARQFFNPQSLESYANSAELYQSAQEHQQRGLYSGQSEEHEQYKVANHRPNEEKSARILVYDSKADGHHYQYVYETENGIKVEESGEVQEKGTAAHGGYSYKGDDGQEYKITYTADENGFRPSGAHLPTPPPIPEEILKSLEQNAKDESAGISDDGQYHEHHEHHQHHDQSGHQEYHHYESEKQSSAGYQSSEHSGESLAAYDHAPYTYSEGKKVYLVPATPAPSVSHESSSGHSYFAPASHVASSGHQESNHIASLGQVSAPHGAKMTHHFTIGHPEHTGHYLSLSHGGNSEHQKSNAASLGQQAHVGVSTQHFSIGHHQPGHYAASNEGSSSEQQHSSHGATYHSGFHASSGQAIRTLSQKPSGFVMHSTYNGNAGLRYLPPTGHEAGYHSHQ